MASRRNGIRPYGPYELRIRPSGIRPSGNPRCIACMYVGMCVYAYVYVCMHVCMRVRMHVCMYVCMYVICIQCQLRILWMYVCVTGNGKVLKLTLVAS